MVTQNKVSAYSLSQSVTPTITAGAYTSADALGGEMVFDNGSLAVSSKFSAWTIQSITGHDLAGQNAAIDLLFFSDSVTPAADNAAASFSDADLDKFLGHVSIAATDYTSLASNSVFSKRNIGLQLKMETAGGDANVYCYAIVRDAPTYASTSDLMFTVDMILDA